jgi:hypothetical protein
MAPVAFQYGEISLNAWLCGWNADTGSTQDACHQMSKKMNSLYRGTAFHGEPGIFKAQTDRLTFHPSLSEINPSGSL